MSDLVDIGMSEGLETGSSYSPDMRPRGANRSELVWRALIFVVDGERLIGVDSHQNVANPRVDDLVGISLRQHRNENVLADFAQLREIVCIDMASRLQRRLVGD